jgi:recombinational DNA repair protein (RecF pathway)
MGYFYAQGIIINSEPLREKDKSVVFITDNFGKIKVKFRSVRSSKSKRSGTSEDFIYQKILLYRKQNFYTATETSLIDSYSELKNSLEGYKILMFIKELLLILLPYEQPDLSIFNLLVATLDCLKFTIFKNSATIYFCMHLFKFLGFPILLPETVQGDYFFSPERGGFNKINGEKVKKVVLEDFIKIYCAEPCNFTEVADFDGMYRLINAFVVYNSDSEHFKRFLKAYEHI